MDINLYFTFLLLSFLVIIVPGPNVLVIVSTSIMHGKNRGLQTVMGTSLTMAIQLVIAGVSTSWFVQILSDGFYLIKWVGVAYLVYIGIMHLSDALYSTRSKNNLTTSSTFSRGFYVSLTNPKTILFFSAFLPQFVSSSETYTYQILILSCMFLLLAVALDSGYAILSAKLKPVMEKHDLYKVQNVFSGLLFLGASAWVAVSRRAQ